MSSSDEHYRYVYLSLICQKYEQAAKRSGTREGATAAMWHSVQSVSMALKSTEVSLSRFGEANDAIADRARSKVDSAKASKSKSGSQSERDNFCDSEVNINLADPNDSTTLDVSLGGEVISPSQPFKQALQKTLDSMGVHSDIVSADEVLDYFDDCWDCDLTAEFSWQIQPLNLLLGFEDFLKDLEDIIDSIINSLNPMDMLVDLCDFFDGFSFVCIPDLIMLLLALNMLITKYVMMAISISFDWTMIIGPIIKWIVDAIAALIQQIMQIAVAPIDCAIGALRTVQELIDSADDLQGTMMAAGEALAGQATLGMTSLGGINTSVAPTPGITATSAANMPGGFMGGDLEGSERWTEDGQPIETGSGGFSLARDVTNSAGSFVSDNMSGMLTIDRGDGDDPNAQGAFPSTIPTGFTVGINDTFSSIINLRKKERKEGKNTIPSLGDITAFKKVLIALQDFKQMIVDFFSQILFVIKSLNSLFGGKLALNVEAMGIIMLIVDLIKLIQILISLKKGGFTSCDDIRNNPEKVMQTLGIVYPDKRFKLSTSGDAIEAEDEMGDTTYIPIPGCTGDLTEGDKMRIKARISKITGMSQ